MPPYDRANPATELERRFGPVTRTHTLWASPAMRRVQKIVDHGAASDLPVLLTGEIGAGKDMLAREIHRRSARANKPLLKLHCAALAPDFFESRAFRREREGAAETHPATRGTQAV